MAKLDVYEAYAPVQSVRIVIITTIIVLVALGVMASLVLAKVRPHCFALPENRSAIIVSLVFHVVLGK